MTDRIVQGAKAQARADLEGLDAGVDVVFPINWSGVPRSASTEDQIRALADRALEAGYNFTDHQMGHGI